MQTAYAATTNATEVASGTASELARLIELVVTQIPLWIAGFVVIMISVIVAKIARRIVENKLAEKGIEEEHQELQILGGRVAYSGVLILGITVGLKIAGIDLTTIIAAIAFGIGFALRDLIMNFLAGIMILLGRHFSIGDFINIGGTLGKVIEIQSRATILQAIDGTKVIVPNAEMFKKQVTNYTSNPFRRIELVVGVDYRHDLENVLKICMNTVKTTKGILAQPKPAVLISDFGESAIKVKMKAWVDSKGGWVKVKSSLAKNLKRDFQKHGIKIPWPIRTVSYDKDSEIVEKAFEAEASTEQKTPEAAPKAPAAQTTPVITSMTPALQPQEVEEEKPLKPIGEK